MTSEIGPRASGYPPDPMSFRCCVGTCPDGVRLAQPLDRTCPPSLWGALSGKAIGSAGIAPQSSKRSLRSKRVLTESKADARGPHQVGTIIGDFQHACTEKLPLVGERQLLSIAIATARRREAARAGMAFLQPTRRPSSLTSFLACNSVISGGGTTIAQLAVTDVVGSAFTVLMRELVLAPLKMEDSSFEQPLSSRLADRAPSAHNVRDWSRCRLEPIANDPTRISTGASSTSI
jgi:hypothetical protein